MWKYLKNYLIGKLLDRWILQTDLNIHQHKDKDYFLHYTNIEINPETFTKTIQTKFNGLNLTYGSVEELTVEINWTEIFRYWTEIRTKYHFSDDESEDELEQISTADCNIKIKNLKLNLEYSKSETKSQCSLEVDEIAPFDCNTDFLKDFLDHIIGQFKMEIDGISLIVDGVFIEGPSLIITPEANGLRKMTLLDNLTIKHTSVANNETRPLCLSVKKGTEIVLIRTIDDFKVKVNISEIYLETETLEFPFTSINSDSNLKSLSFEVTVDLFKMRYSHLNISVHDIFIDDSGAFIVGHFDFSWKDRLIVLESPIQTHVIIGNYKEMKAEIDEELIIRVASVNELKELASIFGSDSEKTNRSVFAFKIRSIKANVDEYNVNIDNLKVTGSCILISSINILHKHSHISFSNVSYNPHDGSPRVEPINPFAELKKFIENDEILSMESEDFLYSQCSFGFDKLAVEVISGQLNVSEMTQKAREVALEGGDSSYNRILIVNVKKIDLELVLNSDIHYNVLLSDLKLLKTGEFIDLRLQLNNLRRESLILVSEAGIGILLTETMNLVEIDKVLVTLPHDIYEILKQDVQRIVMSISNSDNNSDTRFSSNNVQMSLREIKMELRHEELKVPVKTGLNIKEVYYKGGLVYLDGLGINLDEQSVLESGLLKYNLLSKTMTNHCSELNVTSETFELLLECSRFWSDVYTPVMEEIRPEAIIFTEDDKDVGFEDSEDEEFSFEFGISDEEEEHNIFENIYSEIESECSSLCESVCESVGESVDIAALLNDVDEEFFVKRETTKDTERLIFNISDCGFRINLILGEDHSKVTINLSGISGTISLDGINLSVKDCNAAASEKMILGKWLSRVPDVTFKYPVEDGNFLKIKSENEVSLGVEGIDEVNLSVSISPLRLFLDQKLLNSLLNFSNKAKHHRDPNVSSNNTMKAFVFFKKVNISALAIKLDYKVPGSTIPCLKGAELILPRIELRGVKGLGGLGPAVLSAWIPELRGRKLTGVLATGLTPVRTMVNLGGGMVELILLPWHIRGEMSAAQTVSQIRKNGKMIGLETLKLTASLANGTTQLLTLGKSNTSTPAPRDFQSGVQQAAQLIIALPSRLQSNKNWKLQAVPLFILDSAATATGAIAKTLQGIQAEFDRDARAKK